MPAGEPSWPLKRGSQDSTEWRAAQAPGTWGRLARHATRRTGHWRSAMTERDDAPSRSGPAQCSARHLAGASPAAKKVAGARRNPSVVGRRADRAALAARARRRVVAAPRGGRGGRRRVLGDSRVLLALHRRVPALVFTAVLRPLVDVLSRVMPRGLATALAIIFAIAVVAGLLTYVGLLRRRAVGQPAATSSTTASARILDFLKNARCTSRSPTRTCRTGSTTAQTWVVRATAAPVA